MQAGHRIERVRAMLVDQMLDAIIVRDTSDLAWLTGFEDVFDGEQAHVAIITRDLCVLHTDSRYVTAMRERSQDEGAWSIDAAKEREEEFVARTLNELKLKSGRIAINSSMPLGLYRKYSDLLPNARFKERADDVLKLRAVKDANELALMREAQAIASLAFEETLGRLEPGMTERELSLELEFNMKRHGASELAFPNIVASGPNSAKPHAMPGDRVIERGDFVVFDFGARAYGYCSDTTRTVCMGEPDADQLHIYDAVLSAHRAVARALEPGVTGARMHELAEEVLADAGFAGMMGHSLGHGVGIDVHELPALSPRNEKPLVEGNVVTNEPGVYVPGFAGVRIENCGVITANGFESFCDLPLELTVIE